MSRKSNHFRHSFEAHKDIKILNLMGNKRGLQCVGFYFILLEVFGRFFMDDDRPDSERITQEIHLRVLANATGLRTDSVRTCLGLVSDSALIGLVYSKSGKLSAKITIPKYPEYCGSYKKTVDRLSLVKKSKVKEKSSKGGTPHQEWIDDYGQERVDAAILKAEKWAVGKKVSDWKKLTEKFLVEDFTPVPKLEKELEELFEQ